MWTLIAILFGIGFIGVWLAGGAWFAWKKGLLFRSQRPLPPPIDSLSPAQPTPSSASTASPSSSGTPQQPTGGTPHNGGGVNQDPHDRIDDPHYAENMRSLRKEGTLKLSGELLAILTLSGLLSGLTHFLIWLAVPVVAEYAIIWVTLPALGVAGFCFTLALVYKTVYLQVEENTAWVLVSFFGGQKFTVGPGFYLKPSWWQAKDENRVSMEDLTIDLPKRLYTAKGGKGGFYVNPSFTYCVPYSEARFFVGIGPSTVQTRFLDEVTSRIASEVRKYDIEEIAGDSERIVTPIEASFEGDNTSALEHELHVQFLAVTIGEFVPDEATTAILKQRLEATVLKEAAPDATAPLRDKDGKLLPAEERMDILAVLGKGPARVQTEQVVTLRGADGKGLEGLAPVLAVAAAKLLGDKKGGK